MNTPTVEQSTQEIVSYIAKALQASGDFVVAEAPDVLRQVVMMDLIRATMYASVAGIVLTFSIIGYIIIWRKTTVANDVDRPFIRGISGAFLGMLAAGMFIWCMLSLSTVVSANFAPKAHLLERFGIVK